MKYHNTSGWLVEESESKSREWCFANVVRNNSEDFLKELVDLLDKHGIDPDFIKPLEG